MADASPSDEPRPKLSVAGTWRRLNVEQRVAAVGALLLIVSTLGPFSFVEAAIVLTGAAVLLLLRKRAEGREFHIPFGDGTVIAAAGVWAGLLIVVRLFSRPLGQGLLALVCAAILIAAGIRERSKRPPDDIPRARAADEAPPAPGAPPAPPPPRSSAAPAPATTAAADHSPYRDPTLPLGAQPPPAVPKPAKVLPPPPREEDLEEPPAWDDPPR